jgi:hypothetical protein
VFELAKADVKTYITGTILDILDAREQAAKMLDRTNTVESHLDVLLDVAKCQYQEHDGLLRSLNPAKTLSTNGDEEVQLTEKYGPRWDSILAIIRNMHRA